MPYRELQSTAGLLNHGANGCTYVVDDYLLLRPYVYLLTAGAGSALVAGVLQQPPAATWCWMAWRQVGQAYDCVTIIRAPQGLHTRLLQQLGLNSMLSSRHTDST